MDLVPKVFESAHQQETILKKPYFSNICYIYMLQFFSNEKFYIQVFRLVLNYSQLFFIKIISYDTIFYKQKLMNTHFKIDKYSIDALIKTHKFYLELATGAGKSTIIYYTLNNIILKNIHLRQSIIFSINLSISLM